MILVQCNVHIKSVFFCGGLFLESAELFPAKLIADLCSKYFFLYLNMNRFMPDQRLQIVQIYFENKFAPEYDFHYKFLLSFG